MEDNRPTFEVQDSETLLWFSTHIVDKQKDTFTMKFIDPLFKGTEQLVEEARIQFSGDGEAVPDLEYKEGDYIEVKHRQSEEDPAGWCKARIITKRDQFFFVHYENYDNVYDEIILIEQIRPVNTREGPKLALTERVAVPVPGSIQNWAVSVDASEKLNSVVAKTGAYNASYRPSENKIVVVGSKKAINKASILLNFMIDHQCELIELEKANSKISKAVETKRAKILKSDSVEEVLVNRDILGLIIGKGGANITYIKQEYQVDIHIIESTEEDYKQYTETDIPEDKALIRIYGKNPEWVKMASRDIYLERTMVPIKSEMIDYIKGYQNSIVNDMKEKSHCIKVFVHDPENKKDEESVIEVIANEDSLDNFTMLLEAHLEYYDSYQHKETTNRDLNKQMNKFSTNYNDGYQGGETRGGNTRGGGYGGQNNARRNAKNKNYQ